MIYYVDVSFQRMDYDTIEVDADSKEQAEYVACESLRDLYDAVNHVEVLKVREG